MRTSMLYFFDMRMFAFIVILAVLGAMAPMLLLSLHTDHATLACLINCFVMPLKVSGEFAQLVQQALVVFAMLAIAALALFHTRFLEPPRSRLANPALRALFKETFYRWISRFEHSPTF